MFVEPLPIGIRHFARQNHPIYQPLAGHFAFEKFAVRRRFFACDHKSLPGELFEQIKKYVKILVGRSISNAQQKRP